MVSAAWRDLDYGGVIWAGRPIGVSVDVVHVELAGQAPPDM